MYIIYLIVIICKENGEGDKVNLKKKFIFDNKLYIELYVIVKI